MVNSPFARFWVDVTNEVGKNLLDPLSTLELRNANFEIEESRNTVNFLVDLAFFMDVTGLPAGAHTISFEGKTASSYLRVRFWYSDATNEIKGSFVSTPTFTSISETSDPNKTLVGIGFATASASTSSARSTRLRTERKAAAIRPDRAAQTPTKPLSNRNPS